jgi:hypothetical protein
MGDSMQQKRMSLLQDLLVVTHKYEVTRLQLWCEQQLCKHISTEEVCSVLVQAHLHNAEKLEKVCLKYMKTNFQDIVTTASYGKLTKEWPQVVLKVNVFNAGVLFERAKPAVEAQEDSEEEKGEGQEKLAELEQEKRQAGGGSSSKAATRSNTPTKRKRGDVEAGCAFK